MSLLLHVRHHSLAVCQAQNKLNLMGKIRDRFDDQYLRGESWLMPLCELRVWRTKDIHWLQNASVPLSAEPPLDKALCGDEHCLCVKGSLVTDFVSPVLLLIGLLTGLQTVLWSLFALVYCTKAENAKDASMDFYCMFIPIFQSVNNEIILEDQYQLKPV